MAKSKKKTSKKTTPVKKTTTPAKKVTSSYTTTSGQKVTKYSDGTKTYSGGNSSPSSSKVSTPAKQTTPTTTRTTAELASELTAVAAKAKTMGIDTSKADSLLAQTNKATQNPAINPMSQPSDALKNLSVGMAQGKIKNQSQVTQNPADFAKAITDGLAQNNPDTSGVKSNQSTQGEQAPPEGQADTQMVAPQQGSSGSLGGGGTKTKGGATVTPSAPTTATGGYTKIGGAWFQKASDGMRAVSDPVTIAGLKNGTIPSNPPLTSTDGTIFSPYAVPRVNSGTVANSQMKGLATTGTPMKGADEGAGIATTYQAQQNQYGISQTQTDFFSDPAKTIRDITQSVYKQSGMQDANKAIKEITNDLEDLQNERDDAINDVNDNPWLTEGVRLRQIDAIEKKYEDRIANRTNKLALLEDVRNNAQQSAQFAIGTAISLWDKQQTFQQHQIDVWNEQAQREFDNAIKLAEVSQKKVEGTSEMQEYLFSVEQGFNGSFLEYKKAIAAAGRAPSTGGSDGLTPAQINTTVNSIAGAFDNEPIVKEYNTIRRNLDIFNNLGNSATDDIQRVYTFAKTADPNSAVKEGEYDSIEKYSQALLQRAGLRVNRVFNATGILTPEARSAMQKTLTTSLNAAQRSYDQVYNEYQRQIDDARSGKPRAITQYTPPAVYGPTQPVNNYSQETANIQFEEEEQGWLSKLFKGLF